MYNRGGAVTFVIAPLGNAPTFSIPRLEEDGPCGAVDGWRYCRAAIGYLRIAGKPDDGMLCLLE
jgi:hypothetical protein